MKIIVESANAPRYMSFNSESLNAIELAGGKFELGNSSLLIEDLVCGDIVEAYQSASGTLTYANLVTRGSFSALRIFSRNTAFNFIYQFCKEMDALGAGSSAHEQLGLALITVPHEVDFWHIDAQARRRFGSDCIFKRMAVRHQKPCL